MYSKLKSVVIVTLAMMLSACATTGRQSAETRELLTDIATANRLSANIQWQITLDLPASDAINSITPLGNRLVIVEKSNIVVVIDNDTGRVLWTQAITDPMQKLGTPVRQDKQLIITTASHFYSFNIDTGNLDQRFALAHVASTPPLVDQSQVILGSPSGRVFAQLLRSGVTRWEYDMGAAVVTTPVQMPGTVVVVDQTGSVAMLNSSNGHIIWRDVRPPWGPIVAQPIVANAITYVASTDQKLYAFDRISGHVIWQYLSNKPLTADPVAIGDRIYQPTASEGLMCFDGLNGDTIWTSDAPGHIVLNRAGKLWLRDADSIVFVDPSTGIVLNRVPLSDSLKLTVPDIDSNEMYLSTDDGRVLKLGLK